MLLKYIMIFFLSILIGGLITSAFIKDSNSNLFPLIDQSENIECELIEFSNSSLLITSQDQFEALNCNYLLNSSIDFDHGFIFVKSQALAYIDNKNLKIISKINEDNAVEILILEEVKEPYPDLLGAKIFYLEIKYEDLENREIISK